MLAKGYVVGIEFEEAFKDNLYFELAKRANETADLLKEGFASLGLKTLPSPTNQVFLIINKDIANNLINRYGCEKWEEKKDELIIRFVTSFNTKEEDIEELLLYISKLI